MECRCPDFSGTVIGNNGKMCIPANNNCSGDQFVCRWGPCVCVWCLCVCVCVCVCVFVCVSCSEEECLLKEQCTL